MHRNLLNLEKLSSLILALVIGLIIVSACMKKSNADNQYPMRIGIAEFNYTPKVGIGLEGNYRGNDYASRGVHDSIYGRAMVAMDNQGHKVAILTVDICYFKKESVKFMRDYIASRTDIPGENVMILATHTHSGPPSALNSPDAKEYLLKAADAVTAAYKNLKTTTLAIGRSVEDRISHNRRLLCKDGTVHMCWEKLDTSFVIGPLGPKDPEVITLSINQEGKQTGAIINFGCHPTTLTGNNWLFSADYPGYMIESIRKIKGSEFLPIFFNGTCGNVTQVDYRVGFPDTYQECQRIGYLLGVAALEAIKNEQPVNGGMVAVSKEMVPLGRIDISEEQLEWAKSVMKKVEKEGMPPIQADGIPDAVYAKDWIKMHASQDEVDSLEVMVIKVGDVAFVGLPGEMFAEFGIDIKSRSKCKNVMVMGFANDYREYFPTKVSFFQGPKGILPMVSGYETTPGSTLYEPGAGEKLTESAINQINTLFK